MKTLISVSEDILIIISIKYFLNETNEKPAFLPWGGGWEGVCS